MVQSASFSVLQAITARYFSAIGLSILWHDHLITLDDEVEYIWKAKISAPKILFLLVRYIMPIMLFVNSYQQGRGNASFSDTFCKTWFDITAVLFVVVFAIENFLILLRVWVLNDRKRCVIKWTGLFYLAMQLTSIGYATATMVTTTSHFRFTRAKDGDVRLCSMDSRSMLPGAYIPSIIFEAVMITLILWGTHVRSRNMENKSLGNYLFNDGFIYILLLFFFRIANMLITASAPAPLVFASLCFGCATSTMAISRLILDMRKESVNKRRTEIGFEKRSTTTSSIEEGYRGHSRPRQDSCPSSLNLEKIS